MQERQHRADLIRIEKVPDNQSKQVILNDVPFQPGQRVEVLVLVTNESDRETPQELEILLKETQALPHIQALTDEDIVAEVAAYQNNQ